MNTKYEISPEVKDVAKRVLADFSDYFAIDPTELVCVKQVEGYMKKTATIRKIPNLYQAFTKYKLCLAVDGELWNEHAREDWRYALVFHELNHVIRNDQHEYSLRDHDVEDFMILINAIGPQWEDLDNTKDKLRKIIDKQIKF